MSNDSIAQSVIQQMASQIELLISLSLAICGGLIVLVVQVILHNQDGSKDKISMRYFRLWFVSFMLEGLSICFGTLSRSALTAVTPIIFHLDFAQIDNWTRVDFPGNSPLKIAALLQFVFFFLGLLAVLPFLLANQEPKGEPSRAKKR
jgi:hypothetical protein